MRELLCKLMERHALGVRHDYVKVTPALSVVALGIAAMSACSTSTGSKSSAVSVAPSGAVSSATVSPPVQSPPSLPPGGLPPAPSPSPTQTLVSPRVITEADRGAVVELQVGSHVLLQLGPASGHWTRPTLTGDELRIVSSSGGYPSSETLRVELLAVAEGNVSLDDATDDACFHESPPCLRPQGDLHLTIDIK